MKNVTKRNGDVVPLDIHKIKKVVASACEGLPCDPNELEMDAQVLFQNKMPTREIQKMLIQTAVEKISEDNPDWQYVAARLLLCDINKDALVRRDRKNEPYGGFYEMIQEATDKGLYSERILESYSEKDIQELEQYIKPERDYLFNYAGLKTLKDRYMLIDHDRTLLELPQECFMGVAMFLAIPETDRVKWAKEFYDIMSKLEVMAATPTLSNARKPHSQLSSCFVGTIDDSLDSIMDNVNTFAQLSKYGGGVGMDITTVRAQGSEIRGFPNCSGGTVPWIRILNDTAVAVDQLGVRKGALTIHMGIWHQDIMDFMDLKTNSGDDRRKAHDIFPQVGLTDNFMEAVQARTEYATFDPYMVRKHLGYEISDFYGKEFKQKYQEVLDCDAIPKTFYPAVEMFKKILKSCFETGLPYVFFRDTVNVQNPNKHKGIVRSTNLCVTGDTRLATQFGLLTAKELYESKEKIFASYDLRTDGKVKDYGVSVAECIEMHKTAENAEVFEVKTATGYSIKCTEWHEFYVVEGNQVVKKPLNEVQPGEKLLIQSAEGQFGDFHDPELAFLTGLIAADGTFSIDPRNGKQIAHFYLYDDKSLAPLRETIRHTISSVCGRYYQSLESKTINKEDDVDFPVREFKNSQNSVKATVASTKMGRVLSEKFGITKDTKLKVPDFVWKGSRETVVAYLQAVYSTDGTVVRIPNEKTPSVSVQITSKSCQFIKDIQVLLSNLGIRSRVQDVPAREASRFTYTRKDGTYVEYDSNDAYRLDMNGNNALRFYDEVGFFNFYQDKFQAVLDERAKFGMRASRKSEKFQDEVVSIESVGVEDVYDTTQLVNHSLIFNGIVTGNCVEITQNMSPTQFDGHELSEDGEITFKRRAGDLVVCNLSSVNLYRVSEFEELERVIPIQVRMLDNVIDLNYYPVPEAEFTNHRYRAIGLGTMGYHAYLAKKGLVWESDAHLQEVDKLYEKIAYETIKASSDLAKEKGKYSYFHGSDWEQGDWFGGRDLGDNLDWAGLKEKVKKDGLRNGYLLATAPTGSISILAGTTAGIDPVFAKVERTEKKDGLVVSAVPELNDATYWIYKAAHLIDQNWVVRAGSVRQKWIDQSQSMNLFVHPKLSAKELASYYINAWKLGCKTVYYMRSKAVELDEACESCAG